MGDLGVSKVHAMGQVVRLLVGSAGVEIKLKK